MADTFKIPSPSELLAAARPRTGFPVPNQGGIPTKPLAPQRVIIPAAPAVNAGPPGPAPAARPPGTRTDDYLRRANGTPIPGFNAPPIAAPPTGTQRPTAETVPSTGAPVFNFHFGAPAPDAAAPKPGEVWPDATAPSAPGAPTTNAGGEMWPDAQGGQSAGGEMWPDAQAPAGAPPTIPEAPYKVSHTLPHVPRGFEVQSLAPGQGVTTPVGDVYRDSATGRLKLKLSEQGKAAYRQKEQERLKTFGTYPMSHDPLAPTPDVTPGQPVYDAFRGRWL